MSILCKAGTETIFSAYLNSQCLFLKSSLPILTVNISQDRMRNIIVTSRCNNSSLLLNDWMVGLKVVVCILIFCWNMCVSLRPISGLDEMNKCVGRTSASLWRSKTWLIFILVISRDSFALDLASGVTGLWRTFPLKNQDR